MTVIKPEILTQVNEFKDPDILDIFGFEEIYDRNGFPYLAFSPNDYHPAGPKMILGPFPHMDATGRRTNEGTVNLTEQENSVKYFAEAMTLLDGLKTAYLDETGQEQISYSDALKIAHMGIELPRFLLWTDNSAYRNGELPPPAILLSRALRGFHPLVSGLSFGDPPSIENRGEFLRREFNAEEVLDPILNKRALENVLVCAAHINMINLMLRVFDGTKSFTNSASAGIRYESSELLDFSKSLRVIWDLVYPHIEAGRKKVRESIYLELSDPVPSELVNLPEFNNAVVYANMANFVIGKVVNFPVRELSYSDVETAYMLYGFTISQRERELRELVDESRPRDPA